jgi:hypothetical protein
MAGALDHMVTLTYRENMTDATRANADFTKFVRAIRDKLRPSGREWLYVAVVETQKRGAWHWHVAVHGWQDVDLLRTTWQHLGGGSVNVKSWTRMGKVRPDLLASYLAKYIAKSTAGRAIELKHRYRLSHKLVVETKTIELDETDVAGVHADQWEKRCGQAPGVILRLDVDGLGEVIWACSWGVREATASIVTPPPAPFD